MKVAWRYLSVCFLVGLVSFYLIAPVSARDLSTIQRRGELVIAVKDNLRPLGFRSQTGELQGLEIDIAKRLGTEILGRDNVVLKPVANSDRLDAVLRGKVDLTIAKVSITESRSRLVDFSRYYYLDGTGLVTKETPPQKLSEVGTRKIALLNNSSTIAALKYIFPTATFIGVDSYEEGRSLLEAGTASIFAADNSILAGWIQEYPEYHLLPWRLSTEPLGVVMQRGLQYESLRQSVNEALERWQQSGWLQERAKFWGLP